MNILLIEDDLFFQKFYATKLKDQNFQVEVASDGEEGLKKMEGGSFDLILLDLVMPKVDGFEVLRKKAASDTLKNIPVLVFSTLGQDQDVAKAKELGAKEFINKTFFDFDGLLAKIHTISGK